MKKLKGVRDDSAGCDSSDEERELKPVVCNRLAKSSLYQDICASVYESRYVSGLALIVALYVGYIITIAPYQGLPPSLSPQQRSLDALVSNITANRICLVELICASTYQKYIRPVLTTEKIQDIYTNTLYAGQWCSPFLLLMLLPCWVAVSS